MTRHPQQGRGHWHAPQRPAFLRPRKRRVALHLRWSAGLWKLHGPGSGKVVARTKRLAVALATRRCRLLYRDHGQRSELTFWTKTGRVERGNGGKRTYPRSSDPRRSKG